MYCNFTPSTGSPEIAGGTTLLCKQRSNQKTVRKHGLIPGGIAISISNPVEQSAAQEQLDQAVPVALLRRKTIISGDPPLSVSTFCLRPAYTLVTDM